MNILVKKLFNEVELLSGSKLPGTIANVIWSTGVSKLNWISRLRSLFHRKHCYPTGSYDFTNHQNLIITEANWKMTCLWYKHNTSYFYVAEGNGCQMNHHIYLKNSLSGGTYHPFLHHFFNWLNPHGVLKAD